MMGRMRQDAFERLYAEHAQGLLGFLVYRTGDRALAEDLMADAFEKVLRARRPYDPRKASEKTWLYSIALNCLRDSARRTAVEERALTHAVEYASTHGSANRFEDIETADELARALATLSGEEREAVALRFGADLTVPEIAKVLREPLTTIEGRVYRALRKLRSALDG
jgi:RNA polymerase sigma-70 factor (ECF subfamily)